MYWRQLYEAVSLSVWTVFLWKERFYKCRGGTIQLMVLRSEGFLLRPEESSIRKRKFNKNMQFITIILGGTEHLSLWYRGYSRLSFEAADHGCDWNSGNRVTAELPLDGPAMFFPLQPGETWKNSIVVSTWKTWTVLRDCRLRHGTLTYRSLRARSSPLPCWLASRWYRPITPRASLIASNAKWSRYTSSSTAGEQHLSRLR